MKTKIHHVSGGYNFEIPKTWGYLGFGHNDTRQTGGMWYFERDKEEAEILLKERQAQLKSQSNW